MDAPELVFHKELPPEHSQLKHRADLAAVSFRHYRRVRSVELAVEIPRVVVAELLVFACELVVHLDRARIEIRAGTRGDLVVEALERAFGYRVVSV